MAVDAVVFVGAGAAPRRARSPAPANTHDAKPGAALLPGGPGEVFADSAYSGGAFAEASAP